MRPSSVPLLAHGHSRPCTTVVKPVTEKERDSTCMLLKHGCLFVWPQAFPRTGLGFVGPKCNGLLFFDPTLHHMKGGKTNSNNFPKKYDFWSLVHIGFCSSFMWWWHVLKSTLKMNCICVVRRIANCAQDN
jgi:hypothetical protein